MRKLERHGLRVRLGANVAARTRYLAGDDDQPHGRPARAVGPPRGEGGVRRARRLRHRAHRRRAHPVVPAPPPEDLLRLLRQHDDPPRLRARGARLVPRADGGLGPGRAGAPGGGHGRRGAAAARGGRSRVARTAAGPGVTPQRRLRRGELPRRSSSARARAASPSRRPAAETLVPGRARGRLAGGCLSLIVASLGCRSSSTRAARSSCSRT